MTKKPTYEVYEAELVSAFGFPNEYAKAESLYNFNMRAASQGASQGEKFSKIIDTLRSLPESYFPTKPQLLFSPQNAPNDLTLTVKPFKSLLHKIYRRNIYFNKKYPSPPPDGFIHARDSYRQIDDLLRARLICKYMDGPEYTVNSLANLCKELSIEFSYRELSTDAGYYAWHFYFKVPVEISVNSEVIFVDMWIELQFTTQLAEVITTLTHDLYQQRREGSAAEIGWKWKPNSARFRSSYIGHGLHLLEGIIQSFRDDVLSSSLALARIMQRRQTDVVQAADMA